MSDIKETKFYDERTGIMHTKHTYDPSDVLKDNKIARDHSKDLGMGRYKSKNCQLVKVANIHNGDIIRLKALGYDLMSNDPDERKRALCYIQENEPYLMAVPGKPFAKKKQVWA